LSCGARLDTPEGTCFSFPLPEKLVRVGIAGMRRLGCSRQKAEALVMLSRKVAGNTMDLESLESLGSEEVRGALMQLRGVGRWTADYALLRGLGRLTIFPSGDAGALNRMGRLIRARKPLDDSGVRMRLRKWEAFAGLVYVHLLLAGLAEERLL
jgi:DNA-3-methyladenine glycosylase II